MSDLNQYIDKTRQFTAQPDGIPVPDRSAQVNVALKIASRAAQQPVPPLPTPMVPIVPVSN